MAKVDMMGIISEFFAGMGNSLTIYNEVSLQFKLGEFIEKKLGGSYRADFERGVRFYPVSGVGYKKKDFTKKELDIFIYCVDPSFDRFAIEVKYPRGGNVKRMKDFVKDIKFMEEVSDILGIDAYCLTLVSNHRYFEPRLNDSYTGKFPTLVRFFRTGNTAASVEGIVPSPVNFGAGKRVYRRMTLKNGYDITWNKLVDKNGAPIIQTDGNAKDEVYCYLIELKSKTTSRD
ncbi:MAG: hypothetical protein LUD29_06835 [Clostridia bacterium]|nr:hypothetical protein [Clostridia bacterium]